ncbi:hypothetical protein SAMN04488693_10127 [Arthrobacter subterraneus]|uniref:Uncharacterized protein n=1 Tax=Arthrobacter subterraneus TaxID=335973 RepID=A0A1G8BQT9_9MICC|nr:hypothetical protein [Arthrobacter subterraneus]SDH35539.1 hypothetical protein SAMN04488693_10127 [Arthrobacter subterraneus]
MSRPSGLPHTDRTPRPRGVTIIAVILLCEAAALLAVAGWFIAGLLTSTPTSLGGAVFMLALLLLFAGWLLVVAHFFFRGYRWTRSAALVFQFFAIVVAVPTLTGGVLWVGLMLLVPAVLVVHQLFTRPVVEYTNRSGENSTPVL